MDPLIELTKLITQDPDTGKWTLNVRVSNSENIQSAIFIFQVQDDLNVFIGVANVAQILDLPVSTPGTGTTLFLDISFEVELDTIQEANNAFQSVKDCVEALVNDYKESAGVINQEEICIITPTE